MYSKYAVLKVNSSLVEKPRRFCQPELQPKEQFVAK